MRWGTGNRALLSGTFVVWQVGKWKSRQRDLKKKKKTRQLCF